MTENRATAILGTLFALVFLVLGWCLAFVVMGLQGAELRSVFEAEAVKAGAAEYYLDHENKRQFRWKAKP